MATLVAIGYPDQEVAEQARQTVQELESELIIQADQVALSLVISRASTTSTPRTEAPRVAAALRGTVSGDCCSGCCSSFRSQAWRLAPDSARCSATWERTRSARNFRSKVRDYVKPGTSALFMVIEQATPDKAVAALQQYGGTVIETSLSEEDTARLQEALQPPKEASVA